MKKLLLFSVFTLLLVQSIGYCECPTRQSVQAKNNEFRNRARNHNTNVTDPFVLLNEQKAYYNSLVPGCMQYFKSTQSPDCSRLSVLLTGYIMSDKNQQSQYKTQIQNLLNSLSVTCKYQVDTIRMKTKF